MVPTQKQKKPTKRKPGAKAAAGDAKRSVPSVAPDRGGTPEQNARVRQGPKHAKHAEPDKKQHSFKQTALSAQTQKEQRVRSASRRYPHRQSVQEQHAQTQRHGRQRSAKPSRFSGLSSPKKIALVAGIVVALLLLVATALLSWNQWFRYDDKADIQGTWQVQNSTATITITDSQLQLTSDVAYDYQLDTFDKTISFSFGNLKGAGSYSFSPERTTLVISETEDAAAEEQTSAHQSGNNQVSGDQTDGNRSGNNQTGEAQVLSSTLIKVTNADGTAVAVTGSSSAGE